MKKVLFILALLAASLSFGQASAVPHDKNLSADLKDFDLHAIKNGFTIDCEKISGIYLMRTYEMMKYYNKLAWGITVPLENGQKMIVISADIPPYIPTFRNAVVYHELYHALGNFEHCDSVLCPYILMSGGSIEVEEVIKTWNDEAKEEYFNYIKSKQ